MELFVTIGKDSYVLNVVCLHDSTPAEGIFVQINNKKFEKIITRNLVSEFCSYCDIFHIQLTW